MDRQKLIMIFGGAFVAAALLTWLLFSTTQAPKKEKMTAVVAASGDLPAGTKLAKRDLKKIQVAERDMPKGAVTDEKLLLDRALLFPVNQNEPIVATKVSSMGGAEGIASIIEPGKRAISIPFTDATGVSGLIQPRSKVDVLFTRTGSLAEAATTTILEDVTVLSIGRVTEAATSQVGAAGGAAAAPAPTSSTQQRTATLMLTPEESRKLELAKNHGKISLALRNPLDRSRTPATEEPSVTAEAIDPGIYSRMARSKMPKNAKLGATLRDNKAWANLTGEEPEAAPKPKPVVEKKEPPKPRATVDVYRGEKHVQEIFQ